MQPSPSTDIRFESLQTEGSESSNNEDEGDYGNSNSYHPKVRTTKIILAEGLRHALFDWKIVVFGQLLSFLLACGGAAQATLALDCSLSAPSFAIGLYYFVLSFCLIPVYLKGRRQRQRQGMVTVVANEDDYHDGSNHDGNNTNTNTRTHESSTAPYSFFLGNIPLNAPAWGYMILSVMDVYANYFTVLAFKYTTITSVTVFDALAIPSAMFLSRCFLSRQYSWVHLAGVASCMAGILFNVLQDYEDDNNNDNDNIDQAYPHKLRGDLLAITGGLLFGANNVLGEVAVRNNGETNEYLGMLGFFAAIICLIQTLLWERSDIYEFFGSGDLSETCSQSTARWLLFGYVCSLVLIYMGIARFLQVSEATFLNLSFLTGDLWSVAFSVVAQHIVPKPLFFVALVFIVSGVFVYELAPSPLPEDSEQTDKKDDSWREGDEDEVELHVRNGDKTAEHTEEHNGSSRITPLV